MTTTERITDTLCIVGESPVWDAAQAALYWVDIPAKSIGRWDSRSGTHRHWQVDQMVACISLKQSGGLIAGMETGLFSIELGEADEVSRASEADRSHQSSVATQRLLASPANMPVGTRFNDGRCDRQGRFWSGTMFLDMAAARAEGCLYRYTCDTGISDAVVSDLIVQNGLCWSPDGRTMYLSDSHASRQLIWAFDYDIDEGVPSNRRIFVDMNNYPGRPDGAAMDTDGCYWICGNDAACILRFTPEGKLDRKIDLPVTKPSMCAFGGDNLDTLYVTSISAGKPAGDDLAGAIFAVRTGVQGMPETVFRD
ncbi:SMP-30/gluconolactonase/LRE family protein [Undibacterium sp. RuTC16W]|uniref:SMP-30/gluconolactonase/LRE family protein n=1 Tax=Undibacterium sp. RuTC16W TaxID=3413048 RepID=UPI003BF079AB